MVATASAKNHNNRQSFLKMCQIILFAPLRNSSSGVTCRTRKGRKNGAQRHGFRINVAHSSNDRSDSLAQSVLFIASLDEREHAPAGFHLQPSTWQLSRNRCIAIQHHADFAETPGQLAHRFLEKHPPL